MLVFTIVYDLIKERLETIKEIEIKIWLRNQQIDKTVAGFYNDLIPPVII